MNSILADSLTRIRNAQLAFLEFVTLEYSKLVLDVVNVMKAQGYVHEVITFEEDGKRKGSKIKRIKVMLSYCGDKPSISYIKMISKPGRRVYSSVQDLGKANNGLGIKIITASYGVMSDAEARARNVGGEILCEIF